MGLGPSYRTSDGNVYYNETEALNHQRQIDSRGSSSSSEPSASEISTERGNKIIRLFNAGKYGEAIRQIESDRPVSSDPGFWHWGNSAGTVLFIEALAKAIEQDDYEIAFNWCNWCRTPNHDNEEYVRNCQKMYDEAIKAFQRKHGHAITEAEISKHQTDILQEELSKTEENIKGWIYNQKFPDSWLAITLGHIKDWEKLTGRKITREDEIRIYGKPFPKCLNTSSSSSTKDTTSSSSGNGSSIITKIISAVIGAVICGMLLKFLPSFIAVIGGGVAGWFLGSALKKKFIVIGIIAVVVLLAGQQIVGFIGGKLASSETSTEQTTEE